jgi:hypothetical protein
MFIISLIFYLADGTMNSSFLTGLHIGLSLFACLLFIKMIIQFGLPNHPGRFISYLVCLSVCTYFVGRSLTDLNFYSPLAWIRWRSFPLIAGSLCLLLQTIMLIGSFSLIQQKIVSRIPLMASIIGFAFFGEFADALATLFIMTGGIFLIVSVKKARHQKRLYLKMMLMFLIYLGLGRLPFFGTRILGEFFLCFTVFYIFLFEHSFGIAALIDDLKHNLEGDIG